MRLLTCHGEPALISHSDRRDRLDYAILSHTWFEDDEGIVYAHVANASIDRTKRGWSKISQAIQQAADRGFKYIWIDTCCIDKSSSVELSEAINSMFEWYRHAAICMVYLADLEELQDNLKHEIEQLGSCRWFTRGWNLQEMLAPSPQRVHFFNHKWEPVGSLVDLSFMVATITRVHVEVLESSNQLRHVVLAAYSVAQKMSWAATRTTRRKEDRAYCLLGLFDINMPIIYGEGSRSFFRLQESILQAHPHDQSLLLWARDD